MISYMMIAWWIWAEPIIQTYRARLCEMLCLARESKGTSWREGKAMNWSPIMASHHQRLVGNFLKEQESCLPCLLQSTMNIHNRWPQLCSWIVLSVQFTLTPGDSENENTRKTESYSQQAAWFVGLVELASWSCWIEAEAELIANEYCSWYSLWK